MNYAVEDKKVVKDNTSIGYERVYSSYAMAKSYRESIGWDAVAKKALRFVFGDQWDRDIREALINSNRAPSVFNAILPVVDTIVGHWIETRVNVVIKPVDRFADPAVADILTTVMKNVEQTNNIEFERKMQVIDGVITGIGIKEHWVEEDEDFNNMIRVQHQSPWEYYLDKYFRRYDYGDATVLDREKWLCPKDIKRIYGKKYVNIADEYWGYADDGGEYSQTNAGSEDYGNRGSGENEHAVDWEARIFKLGYDKATHLIRVIEHYEKVWTTEKFYYMEAPDGSSGKWENVKDLSEEEQYLVESMTVEKKVCHIHLTACVGNQVAEDRQLKETEFYQLFDFYFPYFINGAYMGVVENLFYPQEEINKRHSTIVHILSSLANSGIYYEDGTFPTEVEQRLDSLLARNGMAIKVDQLYNDNNQPKIKERTAPQVPSEYFALINGEREDIRYIAGTPMAFQGMNEGGSSGKAKQTDIQRSSVRLSPLIDNYRETQKIEGKAILWLIQNYYNEEKMLRVTGDNINTGDQTAEINKQAYGRIFNDITVGKYDVYLEYEGRTASERERISYKLIELANTVPQYADIIGELVLQFSDIPHKDEVIAKYQQRQQMLQQQQQMGMIGNMGSPNRGGIQGAPRPQSGPRRLPQGV